MIRQLRLAPEFLLLLGEGELVEVVADGLPKDATIVGRGLTLEGDFYIDVESAAFSTTHPITPLLKQHRCALPESIQWDPQLGRRDLPAMTARDGFAFGVAATSFVIIVLGIVCFGNAPPPNELRERACRAELKLAQSASDTINVMLADDWCARFVRGGGQ